VRNSIVAGRQSAADFFDNIDPQETSCVSRSSTLGARVLRVRGEHKTRGLRFRIAASSSCSFVQQTDAVWTFKPRPVDARHGLVPGQRHSVSIDPKTGAWMASWLANGKATVATVAIRSERRMAPHSSGERPSNRRPVGISAAAPGLRIRSPGRQPRRPPSAGTRGSALPRPWRRVSRRPDRRSADASFPGTCRSP
jgi:hypothetical protein